MFLRSQTAVKPEVASDSNGSQSAGPTEIELDLAHLPRHIAIIMDGNRRWAKEKGWLAIRGHTIGADTTQNIIQECVDLGLHALTLYTFSTENWKRSHAEVSGLMRLITKQLKDQLPRMQRNNVQIRHIGRRDGLPDYLLRQLDECTNSTRRNTGLVLNLALNYGGRAEIADAFKNLITRVQDGLLRIEEVTEEAISRALYTGDLPEPDLMIRTGGEMRISNFLPWQIAYAELWITNTLWPEFAPKELRRAIHDFQVRERRVGA
ncbi:ditrans,polycis-undecaprenyl-diphosphate synthase ((2E,6E)-farnesyl-diphosphate specific) [Abditibacteriota bacterium]|nr:ditrans,polycis-undecaprenyl-diphosphate synthase ((2E,6E)-farnesyl-diphosphate specific) [Abditibacteriota bacterium]